MMFGVLLSSTFHVITWEYKSFVKEFIEHLRICFRYLVYMKVTYLHEGQLQSSRTLSKVYYCFYLEPMLFESLKC